MLDVILKELKDIQERGGIFFEELTLGGVTKQNVMVKVPLHMVIGDCEGNDHLAAKGKFATCISCVCTCPKNESDNPFRKCKYQDKTKIICANEISDEKEALDALKQLG